MATDIAPTVAKQLGTRLTVWGVGSVIGGAAAARWGTRPGLRAFGIQSAMWGAIDVAIAAAGALSKTPPTTPKLRRLLLINSGLDVGYVATGAHIAVRTPTFGGRITREQAVGHGSAIVVQGAALLVLDALHAARLR